MLGYFRKVYHKTNFTMIKSFLKKRTQGKKTIMIFDLKKHIIFFSNFPSKCFSSSYCLNMSLTFALT